MSVGQIAERLSDRFQLLTGGSRTALPRHQTLRATMDWSHDLLTEPERLVLRTLSVFAGGFTLEAAEAVCASVDADGYSTGVSAADVLDLLARLVDQSLVIADEQGAQSGSDGVRYRMLETVRQYAEEQLTAVGEAHSRYARHAAWCLTLAEAAWPHRQGSEQGTWLARLTVEHDNLRAALADEAAGVGRSGAGCARQGAKCGRRAGQEPGRLRRGGEPDRSGPRPLA